MSTVTNTVVDASALYLSERDAWKPDPGDAPDCWWFYAAFAALRTVLLAHGITEEEIRETHLLHNAVSWTRGESLPAICEQLATDAAKIELPRRPEERYADAWHPEPVQSSDNAALGSRARSIFETHYRKAFPGNRINSKHTKEKWAELEPRALELAREAISAEHAAWEGEEQRRTERRERALAEWQEACAKVERSLDIIRRIIAVGGEP